MKDAGVPHSVVVGDGQAVARRAGTRLFGITMAAMLISGQVTSGTNDVTAAWFQVVYRCDEQRAPSPPPLSHSRGEGRRLWPPLPEWPPQLRRRRNCAGFYRSW